MKAALKRTAENLQIVRMNTRYRHDGVSEILGANITQQAIWLDQERTLAFVCDDMGPMKRQPVNFFLEVPNPIKPIQPIVGDVVFVRTKACDPSNDEVWDYKITDLRDADITAIEEFLSDKKQFVLMMKYFSCGG